MIETKKDRTEIENEWFEKKREVNGPERNEKSNWKWKDRKKEQIREEQKN